MNIKNKNFRDIISGSIWSFASRSLATLIGFLCTVFIARVYGAETVGLIAVVNSFAMIVTMLCSMGFSTSILRLIPEHIEKYSLVNAFCVYKQILFLVVFASIGANFILIFLSKPIAEYFFGVREYGFLILLASLFVVFRVISRINIQAVRALGAIQAFAALQLLPQSVNLFLLIAFWMIWESNYAPIYALLLSFVISALISFLVVEKKFSVPVSFQKLGKTVSSSHLMEISFPMMITGTVTILCAESGIILLSIFGNVFDAGVYASVLKLAMFMGLSVRAISTFLAPKVAQLNYSNNIDEMFLVMGNVSSLLLLICTPILFIFLIFGELILEFVFGHEYVVGFSTLCLLVIGNYVNAITGPAGILLNMTGDQTAFRNITVFGALIFFGANIILIPLFGMIGAGISFLIAEVIWNLSCVLFIRKKYGRFFGVFSLFSGR